MKPSLAWIEKRNAYLKQKYKITSKEFDARLALQNNQCAICKVTFDWDVRIHRPCVDHDHESGIIRGILCGHCNTALGLLKDDLVVIMEAFKYLAQYKKYNLPLEIRIRDKVD